MSRHQRQFSRQRSLACSRSHSQASLSSAFSIINTLKALDHTCVTCVNKSMAESKRKNKEQQQKRDKEEYQQHIARINSTRDAQKELRQSRLLETSYFNKSMILSQKQSQKDIKFVDEIQSLKLIEKKDKQIQQREITEKQSRLELNSKHHIQLKQQVEQEREKRKLESSRTKMESPFEVNRLKLIEQNEQYVKRMNSYRETVQRENKGLIREKQLRRHEDKERKEIEDKTHIETVQRQFQGFSQFMPLESSPYAKSRLLFSQSYANPQQQQQSSIFNHLKQLQTSRIKNKETERETNNNLRASELKKLQEENRTKLKNKLTSMKDYVEQLTQQVRDKRKRQEEDINYRRNYQPQKSKVDYFSEEVKGKDQEKCANCERVIVQTKKNTMMRQINQQV